MTPAEYIQLVVLPTVREFVARPADRRLAYLSTQVTYHVIDYLMRKAVPVGSKRNVRDPETKRIEDLIRADSPEFFAVVEGMCHGAKHCGRDGGEGHQFTPGDEQRVPPFGFGEGFAGFGQGRWGSEGLVVVLSNGERIFVDTAVIGFLLACQRLFPDHVSGLDRSSWAT